MTVPAETIHRLLHPPLPHPSILESCRLRVHAEDFQVDEIPAYVPSGRGEHAWLWIEKRGIASPELVKRICSTLNVASKDVGLAGQKDRHAVTRQYVSLPKRFVETAQALNAADLTVLSVTTHTNKLKTGHLRGNRFRLILRPAGAASFSEAEFAAVQDRLRVMTDEGLPNYFGRQRFGYGGSTLLDGLKFLKGRLPKDHWPEHQTRSLQRLSLSAVQSTVFNLVLADRVAAGTYSTPMPGDVVIRRDGIKPFRLPDGNDPTGFVPAGPMPGPEMLPAGEPVAAHEQSILTLLGLTDHDFRRFPKLTSGVRRKMAEYPADAAVELLPDGSLQLNFTLTAGTYATAIVDHLASKVIDAAVADEPTSDGPAPDEPAAELA